MQEKITEFDLAAAFKALDEIDIPKVKGIRPNRLNLSESVKRVDRTSKLIEDYYDVNSSADMAVAQDERDAEVAQAKLARIEKIVDLNAKSPEELLPSYAGKAIIQCPQCMNIFFKETSDIEGEEGDIKTIVIGDTVNVGEICQHCGNDSGYIFSGWVEAEAPESAEEPAEEAASEEAADELAELPMSDEIPEEEAELPEASELEELPEEPTEEEAEESEEEKTEEALAQPSGEQLTEEIADPEIIDIYDGTGSNFTKKEAGKIYISSEIELLRLADSNPEKEYHYHTPDDDYKINIKQLPNNIKIIEESKENPEESVCVEEVCPECGKNPCECKESCKEDLTEDVDLDKKLAAHNEYIEYLKSQIEEIEKKLPNIKNEEVMKSEMDRLDALQVEFKAALPEAVQAEVDSEELPAADEVPEEAIEEPAEESEEEADIKDVKEDLNEALTEAAEEPEDEKSETEIAKEIEADSAAEAYLEKELEKPISEAEVEAIIGESVNKFDLNLVEEFDENSFNTKVNKYLTEVYKNVDNFNTTDCYLDENQLVVEGKINFKSGKSTDTKFIFTEAVEKDRSINLIGSNVAFASGNIFELNCAGEVKNTKLFTEEFKYKYFIGESLVEGLC